jgi:hypothetical protein
VLPSTSCPLPWSGHPRACPFVRSWGSGTIPRRGTTSRTPPTFATRPRGGAPHYWPPPDGSSPTWPDQAPTADRRAIPEVPLSDGGARAMCSILGGRGGRNERIVGRESASASSPGVRGPGRGRRVRKSPRRPVRVSASEAGGATRRLRGRGDLPADHWDLTRWSRAWWNGGVDSRHRESPQGTGRPMSRWYHWKSENGGLGETIEQRSRRGPRSKAFDEFLFPALIVSSSS